MKFGSAQLKSKELTNEHENQHQALWRGQTGNWKANMDQRSDQTSEWSGSAPKVVVTKSLN